MKKSIEDLVNKWKSDMDMQVDKFESNAEKLRHFELMFMKNFESICALYELINGLRDDSDKAMLNLSDLSSEADQILEQLTVMEQNLDQFLLLAEKNNLDRGLQMQQGDGRYYIQQTAIEVSNTVNALQKDIDEISSRINEPLKHSRSEMDLKEMVYEHPLQKDTLKLDKNEFTSILNSYYNSLRSIQLMQQGLLSKISQVEMEISERRKEKESRNKFY
jgi:hypothetical protein